MEGAGRGEAGRAKFSAMLDDLLMVRWLKEGVGGLTVALPWLPWSKEEDMRRLRGLAENVVEPIADTAEERKAVVAQCSFARCRFADVVYMVVSKMMSFVVRDLQREEVVVRQPDPIPPGWGAWL
ncbi:MAG: hypothetical protein ACE5O2_09365, partial [Armatimonadota bacterium]